jgi:Ca-activated chloride channel family protein
MLQLISPDSARPRAGAAGTAHSGRDRRGNGWMLLAALAASSVGMPLASAQTSDGAAIFRSDTRLVVLHASVIDKKGNLVTNLPERAFKVFENGAEQQIKIFRREDVPVSMGILIDDSGSMREKRAKVSAAALALVKASNRQDEVFVVNFNDEAYLDVPFTNDISKLEEGLQRIDSRGGTALRDAISMSIDYMKQKAKKDKKVIVIITDGNDTASMETLEKTVQKARQSEVLIYAIAVLGDDEPNEAKKAKRALRALTEASGGMAYYPKLLPDVEQLAIQVAHEIRNQYIIAYTPAIQTLDGSFRQIHVKVDAPGRLTVRTRTGYYATPDQPAHTNLSDAKLPGN